MGDLNGDGRPDIVVANNGKATGGWSVGVFLATVAGSFGPVTKLAVRQWPVAIETCDLNGDGRIDYAVSSDAGFAMGVALGAGDGTFLGTANYPSGGFCASLATGDLNGDGHRDVVVSANADGPHAVAWLGNGDGSMASPTNYVESATGSIELADLDGDGLLDLIVSNAGSNSISVLSGNGDGTFGAKVDFADGGSNCRSTVVSDFNEDGLPDVAVSNGSGSVSVLLNQTTPLAVTSASRSQLALEGFKANPAVADFSVACTLARSEPATLELWDVTGRRVASHALGALGAGRHVVAFPEGRTLASGVYWLRLRQGSQSRVVTSVIAR